MDASLDTFYLILYPYFLNINTKSNPNTEGNNPKPANNTPFYKFIDGLITFIKFPTGAS